MGRGILCKTAKHDAQIELALPVVGQGLGVARHKGDIGEASFGGVVLGLGYDVLVKVETGEGAVRVTRAQTHEKMAATRANVTHRYPRNWKISQHGLSYLYLNLKLKIYRELHQDIVDLGICKTWKTFCFIPLNDGYIGENRVIVVCLPSLSCSPGISCTTMGVSLSIISGLWDSHRENMPSTSLLP